jgi:hypothetical protein
MSTGAIIALAVGAIAVMAGGIVALMVWLRRSHNATDTAILDRLRAALPRQGWTFEERNDSYISVFARQREFTLVNPLQPFFEPPRAVAARDVITGTHRGRPFLAAEFDVRHRGEHIKTGSIWVRTPAPGPALSVRRALRTESNIGAGLGLTDLQVGNPDFDATFEVSTENEQFALAVLNPQLIQFLVSDQRLTDQHKFRGFLLLGDQLDVLDPVSDHRDPAELIPALDLRCDILDRIPPRVWN